MAGKTTIHGGLKKPKAEPKAAGALKKSGAVKQYGSMKK